MGTTAPSADAPEKGAVASPGQEVRQEAEGADCTPRTQEDKTSAIWLVARSGVGTDDPTLHS